MNEETLIRTALERRFARAGTPTFPDQVWRDAKPLQVANSSPSFRPLGFRYAAVLAVALAVVGVTAQAAPPLHDQYERFMGRFFVSTEPLQPGIHRADRLTIAQAQSRMSFPIVIPRGLPAHTRFLYAHVLRETPTPQVALAYEAHIGAKYYRISIDESPVAVGAAVAHFEVRGSQGTKSWSMPKRRWNHGSVVMDLFAYGLPSDLGDRIVQANTL